MKLFTNIGINTIVEELNKHKANFEFDPNDNCIIKLDNNDEIVLWSTGHPTMDPTRGFFNRKSLKEVAELLPFVWVANGGVADNDTDSWTLASKL